MTDPEFLCWHPTDYRHRKAFIIIYSILSPIIFITNCTLIVLLFKTKQMSVMSNYFILVMSVSDACIGGIVLPINFLFTKLQQNPSQIIVSTSAFVSFLLMYFSPLMVFTIALDRCLRVFYSKYRQWISPCRVKLIIVGLVLLASTYAAFTTFACSTKHSKMTLMCLLASIIDINFFVVTSVLYIGLYLKVRRSSRSIRQQQEQNRPSRNARHVTYMAITAFLILVSLFICYLPYVAINILVFVRNRVIGHKAARTSDLMFIYGLTICVAMVNSAINALIVLYRNRDIHRYICRVFKGSENDEQQ